MSRTFASLHVRNYRIWFISALIANTGTWMQRVAQDWLVLAILTHDNSFAVGAVTALQFLPLLLFMPVAGTLADRFDMRKILLVTQSAQAIFAFGLGALVLLNVATVVHVCIFAFLLGLASAFDNPPRQVFVSELVPPADLPNAVGLNSTSFNVARLIGPGISGLLIAGVGPGWV
ncbi:MAG: MFS transporter, partial [Ancrocorticia sp.]|nr:MFS transporter [Ancrocorticia sp.]